MHLLSCFYQNAMNVCWLILWETHMQCSHLSWRYHQGQSFCFPLFAVVLFVKIWSEITQPYQLLQQQLCEHFAKFPTIEEKSLTKGLIHTSLSSMSTPNRDLGLLQREIYSKERFWFDHRQQTTAANWNPVTELFSFSEAYKLSECWHLPAFCSFLSASLIINLFISWPLLQTRYVGRATASVMPLCHRVSDFDKFSLCVVTLKWPDPTRLLRAN